MNRLAWCKPVQSCGPARPAREIHLYLRAPEAGEAIDPVERGEERRRLLRRLALEEPARPPSLDRLRTTDARRSHEGPEFPFAEKRDLRGKARAQVEEGRQQTDEIAERARKDDQRAAVATSSRNLV